MAVPFAQPTRSLNADRGITTLIWVALLSLLLTIWLIWAFSAQFSVSVSSEPAPIRLDDSVSAFFSSNAGKQLKIGQKALIYLDAPPLSEPVVLPAQVIAVDRASDGFQVQVAPDFRQIEGAPVNSEILAAFSTPVSGHVAVEVESISPALLLLRSAGINADTAPLVSRP